ncbi:TPA: 3-dehydroquinate synthase [Candidatus Poribacteria bacterium]|nr:3-dehydroquinate synthase [Candidatus Poribacteria bacterium]
MEPIDTLSIYYEQPGTPIYVGSDILDQLADKLQEHAQTNRIAVVTNSVIRDNYGDALQNILDRIPAESIILQVPDSEEAKSWDWVSNLIGAMEQHGMDRNSTIIAFGGGVVGDMAGFTASVYKRGISFVQIPTTLLAQVDSSIGGKVAINHPMAKNLIGAFYQPRLIYIDTKLLNTLPLEDFRSGIAEIIKAGVIMDADFFAYLEKNIDELLRRQPDILRYVVEKSCRYKIDVVKKDPLEKSGLRKILNYGHTVGHALEAVSNFKLRHGEGVSIGMVVAMQLAIDLSFADASCAEKQSNLLKRAGLPTEFPDDVNVDELIDRIRLDKKGAFRFVLPSKIGAVKCDYTADGKVIYDHKLSIEQIRRALKNGVESSLRDDRDS